uniref:PDZ domain-containing protein n=1 Tax=Phlebotomus papatasi TaxID=29031 RepID=A0A1B0DNF8_PHLPP
MAQLVNVRLNRSDAQPWGFRLQGGKDFGTPLVVQKTPPRDQKHINLCDDSSHLFGLIIVLRERRDALALPRINHLTLLCD